jgi:hypothetical protein
MARSRSQRPHLRLVVRGRDDIQFRVESAVDGWAQLSSMNFDFGLAGNLMMADAERWSAKLE